MRMILKYSLISLAIMVLLTYYFGWKDMIANGQLTGNWLKDFLKSISYYVGWVLPYWWLLILIGTVILTLLGLGIKFGIDKIKG
jgi:hypothetical protein